MRRTPRFDVYIFTSRLSPLLAAGIPLEHGLAVLEEGGREEERHVVQRLRRGLHEGKKFSQLTREMPECFPPLFSGLIETGEESGCLPEVTREPELALFGGADGLDFYRRISREASEYLNEGGCLLFEIGWLQKDAVSALVKAHIGEPFALRDYGQNWRVVGAKKEGAC